MKRSKKGASASASVDLMALGEIVERFEGKRIVVLGDFVADSFQYGDITRVSREAPVLILRHRETRIVPGGGANAANNFASLGARVIPISVVGDDSAGHSLVQIFRERKVDTSGILRVKGWITPTKTRFLAGWAHTVGHQVLRVDYEPQSALPEAIQAKILKLLASRIKTADALAISDYGFGAAVPETVHRVMNSARRSIPVSLDSRYRLTAFRGTGVTAATPNECEIEALRHTTIGRDTSELERCGCATLNEMKLSSLVVTRGKDGVAVFQPDEKTIHIPVHGSDQAVDVTGAGDTVLAAYTLGLACGASPVEAAHIANVAGGLVVMKRGTATVSRHELLDAIHKSASETTS
ncbi:MAG TPA: PfkB family carbohydrate kinase [Candidatus Limnocylindrales bacterium]|nr:PfkB family carbohydrate kinase [Candidatus Limnocylindrales bacterium]